MSEAKLEGMKFCKHCNEHHTISKEFWEFRKGVPYRCKTYRRFQYHNLGGKEKAKEYYAGLSDEKIMEINERKREAYYKRRERKED